MLPTMKLYINYSNGQPFVKSASPEADALFELIKRKTIEPKELNYIHKMGFELEFVGDISAGYKEFGKKSFDYKKLKKEVFDK